nr:MAG TPA: hypothetical protein [Caudoviricetes sp.]
MSNDGEPCTSRGVSTVLRGDYTNLLQKYSKAVFSYSTRPMVRGHAIAKSMVRLILQRLVPVKKSQIQGLLYSVKVLIFIIILMAQNT